MKTFVALILFLISLFAIAQEGPGGVTTIEEIESKRVAFLMERFTGTFQDYKGTLLSLEPDGLRFKLHTLDAGSRNVYISQDFGLDFILEDSVEKVRNTTMGRAIRETRYELTEFGIHKTVITTNRWTQKREVIKSSFSLGQYGIVHRSYSRSYEKRAHGLWGDWVDDRQSERSRLNTVDPVEQTFLRFKPEPLNLYEVAERGLDWAKESVSSEKPRYFEKDGVIQLEEVGRGHRPRTGEPADILSFRNPKVPMCRFVFRKKD